MKQQTQKIQRQSSFRSGLARANGIELYYEDMGDLDSPPVLLIMGLGAQHVYWPDGIVDGLLSKGYRVIRFDNRDIGMSTRIDTRKYDILPKAYLKAALRERISTPYTLFDMVEDTQGLLDVLKISSAHLVGVSMGGMVAQLLAALHRDRVRSLTSIMSSTLHPKLPWPRLEVMVRMALMGRRGRGGREDYVRQTVAIYRAIHGKGFPFPEDLVAWRAGVAFDRGYHPRGPERQAVGILATGTFEPMLSRVRAPTLVVHGDKDPLVSVEGGKATAEAIRGAQLEIIPGMGHFMHEPTQPDLVAWMDALARRAEG